jgi:hypothetical protein
MLYLNGYDLQKLPLIERKDCLGGCWINRTFKPESFEVDGPTRPLEKSSPRHEMTEDGV